MKQNAQTNGLNHLGLSVKNLSATTNFFVEVLDWQLIAEDPSYPRTTVTDGKLRLTLWQVTDPLGSEEFDRHKNIGLHHLAIEVETLSMLETLDTKLRSAQGVSIEFSPENVGTGPRKHMMFNEPSGIRIELIWMGA